MTLGVQPDNDLFHLVFFVALFSVSAQGTLIPFLAKKLKLVETETSVLKTFTDYEEESPHLIELTVTGGHPWLGKTLLNADIPEGIRVVMIRRNGHLVIPDGSTLIEDGDVLVVSGEDLSALDPASITAAPGTPDA